MTTRQDGGRKLEWTGERYVPEIAGSIRLEHLHRYYLAQELSKDQRVLDIACGEGYGSDLLARTAALVVGVDIVPEVVRHAHAKYARQGLTFAAGNCVAIPLADRSVDVVVSFETLEHHDQHDEMMREVKRVLRPDGLLIMSSPDRREYSDVQGNQNRFHSRELYRGEFDQLLKSHFQNVRLVGQRVMAGSLAAPIEAANEATFLSFADTESHEPRAVGLRAPLYFIGFATDGRLPRIPTGLLEGGDFLWPEDHTQAVHAVLTRQQDEAARATAMQKASVEVWRAEVERHVATIAAVSVEKGRAEERAAWLEQEIERGAQHLEDMRRQLDEVERERIEAHRLATDAHSALDGTRTRLRAAEGKLAAARALEAERNLFEEQTKTLKDALEQARERQGELTATIDRLEVVRATLERKIHIIEHSSSWRLTSPLRASRRLTTQAPRLARKTISDSTRSIYRALPLPAAAKLRLKNAIFHRAPWLVGHTLAYRTWLEQARLGPAMEAPLAEPVAQAPRPEPPRVAASASPTPAKTDYVPLTIANEVKTAIRAIAFYVPQFHPTPETDRWWGKGFTDWHPVARGRPRFAGHFQPHVPGELGFYDLRLIDVQRRQIELAKTYGLHGFCYHHYWFDGTRLLGQPLDQLLANRDLDFPFCLCWTHESWTRTGSTGTEEILVAQRHTPEDDLAFLRDIESALRDPRYIRVGGRPLLVVYRPALLPDVRATAERWRRYCRDAGIGDLFLVAGQAFEEHDPRDFGFDAALELAPNPLMALRMEEIPSSDPDFQGTIYDYRDLVEYSRHYERPADYPLFRSVAPMWDNEARYPGSGTTFVNSSPALYGEWLEQASRYTLEEPALAATPFVFINAWNEWVHAAHLEPDRRFGYAYLQATADALRKFPGPGARPSIVVVSHDAHFFGAQLVALTLVQTLSHSLAYDVEVLLCGQGPLREAFAKAGRVHDFFSSASTPEVRERIVRDVYARGARIALCNTSCIGEVVHLLKEAGFSIISMIHELPGVIREFGLEASSETIARDAARVVFPAGIVRDRFIELTKMAPDKAVVRPQGLLASNRFDGRRAEARRELRSRLGLDQTVTIVLAVAPASLRKGIDLFVDAGLQIVSARDDVVCVWVGNPWGVRSADEFTKAHASITQAGAEGRFRFPGHVEDPDVFFAGADVYLMTSREDPFPLVVLHALDAELPVIGFEGAGGFAELLHRGCGVLVPYLDSKAMAAATVRVLGDPSEARRLASAGKAIVKTEFAFVDYARDLVRLGKGPRRRVSAIVPNYNYAHHLPARLRSILTQTYAPHEIIFLDDCSSDDSVGVAEALLKETAIPHRIIRNDQNQGVYRQWLRGVREATGDLIWIAEADDDCSPSFLETLVPAFARDEVVLAYCQSKQIDESGNETAPDYLHWTSDVHPTKWREAYLRRGPDEIRDSLVVKNTIPNVSAVLMRKPDLSGIESQLITMRNAGDWLVYVHLLERGSLAYVPQALNRHRRHGRSVTIGHGGLNLMREMLVVERYILDRHPIGSDVEQKRERHLQEIYEYLGLNGDGPPSYKDHQALISLAGVGG